MLLLVDHAGFSTDLEKYLSQNLDHLPKNGDVFCFEIKKCLKPAPSEANELSLLSQFSDASSSAGRCFLSGLPESCLKAWTEYPTLLTQAIQGTTSRAKVLPKKLETHKN